MAVQVHAAETNQANTSNAKSNTQNSKNTKNAKKGTNNSKSNTVLSTQPTGLKTQPFRSEDEKKGAHINNNKESTLAKNSDASDIRPPAAKKTGPIEQIVAMSMTGKKKKLPRYLNDQPMNLVEYNWDDADQFANLMDNTSNFPANAEEWGESDSEDDSTSEEEEEPEIKVKPMSLDTIRKGAGGCARRWAPILVGGKPSREEKYGIPLLIEDMPREILEMCKFLSDSLPTEQELEESGEAKPSFTQAEFRVMVVWAMLEGNLETLAKQLEDTEFELAVMHAPVDNLFKGKMKTMHRLLQQRSPAQKTYFQTTLIQLMNNGDTGGLIRYLLPSFPWLSDILFFWVWNTHLLNFPKIESEESEDYDCLYKLLLRGSDRIRVSKDFVAVVLNEDLDPFQNMYDEFDSDEEEENRIQDKINAELEASDSEHGSDSEIEINKAKKATAAVVIDVPNPFDKKEEESDADSSADEKITRCLTNRG